MSHQEGAPDRRNYDFDLEGETQRFYDDYETHYTLCREQIRA